VLRLNSGTSTSETATPVKPTLLVSDKNYLDAEGQPVSQSHCTYMIIEIRQFWFNLLKLNKALFAQAVLHTCL
jgi:hypothetical protein